MINFALGMLSGIILTMIFISVSLMFVAQAFKYENKEL